MQDESEARSFNELVEGALAARAALCQGARSLEGARVGILASPGVRWIEAFFGAILGGGVAVPLSPLYPPSELAWFGEDAEISHVVISADQLERGRELSVGRKVFALEGLRASDGVGIAAELGAASTAVMLYTSGTTGKPKGALIAHGNLVEQVTLLGERWQLGESDRLLHALPLHHLHGLGISLLNVLLSGGSVTMLPKFDAVRVWEAFADEACTVWMAVPTMYQKLFEAFDAADDATRSRWARGASRLRLATSGSAALPVTLAERWRAITGAIPLERFGMTEIGVGMSNPFEPSARRAGTVGTPLRSVEWRIKGDDGANTELGPGELFVRGPSVFSGYFKRDSATREAFKGGWFATGDVAERSSDGYVKLLGRTSVDILKSGGYKLSALEIEEVLRESSAVAEVAVVGLPDPTWGDRVVAVVVPSPGRAGDCTTERLRAHAAEHLPPYKIPREVVVVESLPRNALGKVVKPDLIKALVQRNS
jgi:malonyl-CoA/methylmalonyl-CoA synthetase